MSSVEERGSVAKLEALSEIRSKMTTLERLRLQLLHQLGSVENEDRCMDEFRREMELLQQEKMAHVEELRQIHADINAMEAIMKQAEDCRRQAMEQARRVVDEYAPLKNDVDHMRVELLGLEKLPDLTNEDKQRLANAGLLEKPRSEVTPTLGWPLSAAAAAAANLAEPDKSFLANLGVHRSANATSNLSAQGMSGSNPFLAAAAAQHSALGLGPLTALASGSALGKGEHLRTSLAAQTAAVTSAPPPFRQQPPPMKNCLSCHQQIHRNAPICPLCKAKSRSRNPKKPKKKD